jgi:hypothetical protein
MERAEVADKYERPGRLSLLEGGPAFFRGKTTPSVRDAGSVRT